MKRHEGIENLTEHLQDAKDRVSLCEVVEGLGGQVPAHSHDGPGKTRLAMLCPRCKKRGAGGYCRTGRFFCDRCRMRSVDPIELIARTMNRNHVEVLRWLQDTFPGITTTPI